MSTSTSFHSIAKLASSLLGIPVSPATSLHHESPGKHQGRNPLPKAGRGILLGVVFFQKRQRNCCALVSLSLHGHAGFLLVSLPFSHEKLREKILRNHQNFPTSFFYHDFCFLFSRLVMESAAVPTKCLCCGDEG